MNKLTTEKCREQFEKWWESFYETSPREPWSALYSPEHDYYVDGDIDGQYDAWKASRQALEIALPVLEQQEKGDGGWIEWKGGKCPVPPRAIVVVRYRKGKEEAPGEAGGYFWCHAGSSVDIIAYRVVQDRERGEEE